MTNQDTIKNRLSSSDLTGDEIPDMLLPTMKTVHRVVFEKSGQMKVDDESVHLTITSPPYPMIAMWDFIVPMDEKHPQETFEKWHLLLDETWKEVWRVTKEGGFICINIGDATRTVNKKFSIFPNHVRITNAFMKLGASILPSVVWQKPTNSPNKFMGSGRGKTGS